METWVVVGWVLNSNGGMGACWPMETWAHVGWVLSSSGDMSQNEGGPERRYGPSGDRIVVVVVLGLLLRSTNYNKEAQVAATPL